MQTTSPVQAPNIKQLLKNALALFNAGQYLRALGTICQIPELQVRLQTYSTRDPHRDVIRLTRKAILDGFEHYFRAMGFKHLPCEPFSMLYCELSSQHSEAWREEQAVWARKFRN